MPEDAIKAANIIATKLGSVQASIGHADKEANQLFTDIKLLEGSIRSYEKALEPLIELRGEAAALHHAIIRKLRGFIGQFSWHYLERQLTKELKKGFTKNGSLDEKGLSFQVVTVQLAGKNNIFCVSNVMDVVEAKISGTLQDRNHVLPTQQMKVNLLLRVALRSTEENNLILVPVLARPVKVQSSLATDGKGAAALQEVFQELIDKKLSRLTLPAKIELPFIPTKATENRWQTKHDSHCLITHMESGTDCTVSGHFFSFASGVSSQGKPIDLPPGVLTDVVVQNEVFGPMPDTPKLDGANIDPNHQRPGWADAAFHIHTPRFTQIISSELARQVYAASSAKDIFQAGATGHARYAGITTVDENGTPVRKFSWFGSFPVGWYQNCVKGGFHFNNWKLEYRCDEWGKPFLLQLPVGASGEIHVEHGAEGPKIEFLLKILGSDQYRQSIPIPLGEHAERVEYTFDDDFISFFVKYKDE